MGDEGQQLELLPRRGGRRPGAGRPRTGVSNVPVATRLSMAEYEMVLAKCEATGEMVSEWVGRAVRRELYQHLGEGTRKRLRREQGE